MSTQMNLLPEIVASSDMTIGFRRHLHRHPELGYDVHQTADFVAARLAEWGIPVTRGIGKTGLVGTLKRGNSERAIGLRADMDALPIAETNTFAHRSQQQGVMHACGHDGHTSMLLGAAHYLAHHGQFDGTVQFIFQPAEEAGAGGQAMVQDGLFSRFPVDAVFGVHNWPGLPAGYFGTRAGPLMAAGPMFHITVKGTGGHAARPHTSSDALLAASHLVVALQSVVSRNVDPLASAVLSVVKFNAGTANNIIPAEASLMVAVRTFGAEMTQRIEGRVRKLAQSVAEGFACEAVVDFMPGYPATINDPDMTRFALSVASDVVGEANVSGTVTPTMTGEDFAYMLQQRPGCYAFIGNGDGQHRGEDGGSGPCELHNDSYDFNDDILPVGATYFSRLAERFLA